MTHLYGLVCTSRSEDAGLREIQAANRLLLVPDDLHSFYTHPEISSTLLWGLAESVVKFE